MGVRVKQVSLREATVTAGLCFHGRVTSESSTIRASSIETPTASPANSGLRVGCARYGLPPDIPHQKPLFAFHRTSQEMDSPTV